MILGSILVRKIEWGLYLLPIHVKSHQGSRRDSTREGVADGQNACVVATGEAGLGM